MGQEAAREGLGAELGTKENRGGTLRLGKPTGKRGATGKTGVPRTNGHRPSRRAVQLQRASPSQVPDEITGTTWPESTEPGCGSVGSPAGRARVRGNPTLPIHRHHCSPVSSLVRFSHWSTTIVISATALTSARLARPASNSMSHGLMRCPAENWTSLRGPKPPSSEAP